MLGLRHFSFFYFHMMCGLCVHVGRCLVSFSCGVVVARSIDFCEHDLLSVHDVCAHVFFLFLCLSMQF